MSTSKAKVSKRGGHRSAALLALTALLAPNHAEPKRRVGLAIDDPDAYAKKYAKELEDRFAEDDPVDPWLALVTALTNEDIELAASIDWKDSAEEIQAALARVVAKKKLGGPDVFAFYDEDAHIKTKTLDFITLCGRALSAHGLAVVELDLPSDSYELTVIPWKDVARAKDLAKKAGRALVVHGPKTPLAKPLAAPPPKPGPPAKIDKKKFGWCVAHDEDFARLPGVLRTTGEATETKDTRKTFLLDCRVWPPKEKLVAPGLFKLSVHPADEAKRILYRVYLQVVGGKIATRPSGLLRVERPNHPPVDLLARIITPSTSQRGSAIARSSFLRRWASRERGRSSGTERPSLRRRGCPRQSCPGASSAASASREPEMVRMSFSGRGWASSRAATAS